MGVALVCGFGWYVKDRVSCEESDSHWLSSMRVDWKEAGLLGGAFVHSKGRESKTMLLVDELSRVVSMLNDLDGRVSFDYRRSGWVGVAWVVLQRVAVLIGVCESGVLSGDRKMKSSLFIVVDSSAMCGQVALQVDRGGLCAPSGA